MNDSNAGPGQADQDHGAGHEPGGNAGDWTGALPDDARRVAASKGWRSPADAVQSYAHLESKLGARRVAVPGEEATDQERDEFHREIGAPEHPDDYALPEGIAFDDNEFEHWSRTTAHRLGLTSRQFAELAGAFQSMVEERQQAAGAGQSQSIGQAEQALRHEWGASYDARSAGARRAAQALGVPNTVLQAMAQATGLAPVTRFFADLYERYGIGKEDSLRMGASPSGFGLLSQSEAMAQIKELEGSKAYRDLLARKRVEDADALLARRDRLYAMAYPEND